MLHVITSSRISSWQHTLRASYSLVYFLKEKVSNTKHLHKFVKLHTTVIAEKLFFAFDMLRTASKLPRSSAMTKSMLGRMPAKSFTDERLELTPGSAIPWCCVRDNTVTSTTVECEFMFFCWQFILRTARTKLSVPQKLAKFTLTRFSSQRPLFIASVFLAPSLLADHPSTQGNPTVAFVQFAKIGKRPSESQRSKMLSKCVVNQLKIAMQ